MGQQGGGDDKNSFGVLWGIGLVFAIGAVLWYKFSAELKIAFIFIRYWELWAINWVTQFIPFFGISEMYASALNYTKNLSPALITTNDAKQLSILTGRALAFPYLVILYFLFKKVQATTITAKYKKRYDMHSLRDQERSLWPQVNIVSKINLLKEDLDEGPWAMAHTPMQFAKHYDLLKITVIPPPANKLAEGPTFQAEVNKSKTEQVFASQLGKMWKGHKYLPDYKRAILAAFVARGCRDSAAAMGLIKDMNASLANSDEVDYGIADELLEKHIGKREVQEIIAKHAYENTIFIALFLFAREDGVFPTSDFLWIKPLDRRFWYVLNNVGRQTPSIESAGVHAHFLAERALNRKMTVPMVQEAVKALQYAIDEIIYEPSNEEREKLIEEQFGDGS